MSWKLIEISCDKLYYSFFISQKYKIKYHGNEWKQQEGYEWEMPDGGNYICNMIMAWQR